MNIFFNESVTRVPLSLTAVLLCLTPAVVMLFSAVIFKEKITLKKLGCMVMIIAGCLLVSGILENGRADTWSLPGVMSGIISAVFYAFYSVFSKLAVQRGYSGLTTAFYSILFVAIVTSLFADWNTVCEYVAILPAENSAIILAHCIYTSILPYGLYTVALRYADGRQGFNAVNRRRACSSYDFRISVFWRDADCSVYGRNGSNCYCYEYAVQQ